MKLKNKRTREIIDVELKTIEYPNSIQGYPVYNSYNSLAELNEEWEDYKEPKEYWYMDYGGRIKAINDANDEEDVARKEIGNYFETKEEAERAVEKLKAWKRLKDKGFRFERWFQRWLVGGEYNDETRADLDLVFTEEDGDV